MSARYFYVINYPASERKLCLLEMKSLFGRDIISKYFYADLFISPSRSVYIKCCLEVFHRADSFQGLCAALKREQASYERFRFVRFDVPGGTLRYPDWVSHAAILGEAIEGDADMISPAALLGFTCVGGEWVFGAFNRNTRPWEAHLKKPHSYSNALPVGMARSIVNIAVGSSTNTRLVDPCCGIGTVVLEALSMGIDTRGSEINWPIVSKANDNLESFGYGRPIVRKDMHELTECCPVGILDLPYGVYSRTTEKRQQDLIMTMRRISERAVIIASMEMDTVLGTAGFSIQDQAVVKKGQLSRIIYLCD